MMIEPEFAPFPVEIPKVGTSKGGYHALTPKVLYFEDSLQEPESASFSQFTEKTSFSRCVTG